MTEKTTKYPTRMADIAALAGVSRAAVSVVLRQERGLPVQEGRMRFSEKTRKKILDTIKKTGYMPSSIGQALASGKSSLIGLLIDDISSSFLPEVIEAIEDETSKHRYGSLLMTTRNDPDRKHKALELMLQKRIDGLLVLDYGEIEPSLCKRFESMAIPVVYLFNVPEKRIANSGSVRVDGKKIGEVAAEHLLALGHRRIACIGLTDEVYQGVAQHDRNANAIIEYWQVSRQSSSPAEDVISRWKSTVEANRPTALFISSDDYSIAIINLCIQMGIKVPDELSIVGIDDIPQAAIAAVPLTTIRQPKYGQGEAACQLLFNMIDGNETSQISFQPELIIRKSTCRQDVHMEQY